MKFHDELNPVLWDKENDNQMRPEVIAKLQEIAEAFIEYLEIPQDAVLDKVVTGSSASYNYNEFSDLDLHIIVDYDKVHKDCPLVQGYLGALKNTFNKEHDITIHDVPVELYAEAKDQGTVHNGLYSVQEEEWIDRPKKIEPTDNDAAVEAKYYEIKDMVDKCNDSETATELLDKIYTMRKAGLATAGEFCTENLAFKKLRNEGCMDKLRQIKKEQIDKQLSLESYTEDWSAEDIDKYNKERLTKVKQALEEQFKRLGFTDVDWDEAKQIYFFRHLDEPYYIVINTPGINGTGYDLYKADDYGVAKGRLLTYRDVWLMPEDVTPFVRAILSDIHKFILVNESMEEDYEDDDCEDIPEEMHKERYVTYFETQEGRQKYTIYHVYTDSTDDSYNELCDKKDNQLGMYNSYKELKDALKERAEKIAVKQGWTVKSIDNLGEDDEYYRERNKWESIHKLNRTINKAIGEDTLGEKNYIIPCDTIEEAVNVIKVIWGQHFVDISNKYHPNKELIGGIYRMEKTTGDSEGSAYLLGYFDAQNKRLHVYTKVRHGEHMSGRPKNYDYLRNTLKPNYKELNNFTQKFKEAIGEDMEKEPVYHYSVEDIDKQGNDFDNAEEAYEQAQKDLTALGYEVKELNDDGEFEIVSTSTGVAYTGVIYPSNPELDESLEWEICRDMEAGYFYICNDEEIYCDPDGEPYHFDTREAAEEFLHSLNEDAATLEKKMDVAQDTLNDLLKSITDVREDFDLDKAYNLINEALKED